MGKKKEKNETNSKTSIGKNMKPGEKRARKNVSLKKESLKDKKAEIKEKPVLKSRGLKQTADKKKTGDKKTGRPIKASPAKPKLKKTPKTTTATRKIRSSKMKVETTQEQTPMLPETMSAESAKFQMKPPQEEMRFITTPLGVPRDLPVGYGDTKVVILVRDPEWIFAYWEINDKNRIEHNLLRGRHDKTLALRIYDITGVKFNGVNANRFYDVIINDYAVSWYLRMPEVNRTWCVDLGYYDTQSGNYVILARSNTVKTPAGAVSEKADDEWMQIKEGQYEEILRISGGLDIKDFRGSENLLRSIADKIKIQVEKSLGASGSITSSQAGNTVKEKSAFWLTVNTDIIVYGATEPGATVTIQDKDVSIREDGTFSVYFSLPDGVQIIPVKAVNSRKTQEREISQKIIKETR